jgi:type IV pilus assembly protein PilX
MHSARRQRGISLLVVMIVVLLSSLLALWAFRSSLVNEAIVGNDADYQRAFEAAQAMIQDAEMDIRGERADGRSCVGAAAAAPGDAAGAAVAGRICRIAGTLRFPEENKELIGLLAELDAEPTRCRDGICQKRTGIQDFWTDDATFRAMTRPSTVSNLPVGARYGQYTGALPPVAGTPDPAKSDPMVNPLLTESGADRGAWYWIEVMPYDTSPGELLAGRAKLVLNLNPNVVYRITAVAVGLKPRTRVVLQSTFVRQKIRN